MLLPEWVGSLSVREMADMLLGEAVEGVGGVRCGVMYVACSYPLKDVEKKTLQAAVLAHRDTGMRLVYNVFSRPFQHISGLVCYAFKILLNTNWSSTSIYMAIMKLINSYVFF